jgi:hypothetical protein
MTINKGGSPNSTVLTVLDPFTALTYDGTLTVTNIGDALVIGDSFTLFDNLGGSGYGGAFTNLNLPPLGDGQAWQDNSAVDGTIKVIAGSVPPSITTDLPSGTTYAYAGVSFTLSIAASGDPILHYQWKNGTTPVGTDSPTLTLSSVTPPDSGDYSVTVTNPYGSAPSSTHHLTVEAPPSSYPAAVIQDAPLTYYPLGESDPATAYDYSGAGHDGGQNGVFALGVDGPRPPTYAGFTATNTAYQFDGTSTYIDCGAGSALSGTTDFTLEAWINTTSTLVPGMIIQQRGAGFDGEYTFIANTNGTLSFTVYGGGGYQFTFSSSATAKLVNDGTWHDVVAVRSGATGTIYIDGAPAGSASGTVAPLDPTFSVTIGRDSRDFTSYFNGLIADVAIYNYALSPTRIAVHAFEGISNSPIGIAQGPGTASYAYVGGSPTFSVLAVGEPVLHYQWKKNGTTPIGTDSPTLTLPPVTLADSADYSVTVTNLAGSAQSGTNHLTVLSPSGYPALVMATGPSAYWPLSEAAGPPAFDYAGNHTATYSTGGVTYGVTGPVGANVVAVNGTNGQVAASYSSDLNPSGPFTVEAWLNPASVGGTMCALASFHEGVRAGWLIYVSTAGWNLRTYNQNGQNFAVNLTGGTPTVGTWNQVTGVWDGSKGYLYVNGVLQGTSAATNFVANPDGPFTIGSRSDSTFYWGGSVGDVAFYNRALSSQEIQSHALNRPILILTPTGNTLVLTWLTGTLQAAREVTGTYTNVPSATSPWPVTPTQARTFYRLAP